MQPIYWEGLIAAFVLSVILNRWLIILARRKNWFMPSIRPRDEHTQPVPRTGGIALVLAFLVVIVAIIIFNPATLRFSAATTLGIDRNLLGFLIAVIILGVFNVTDDYRGLSWPIKLFYQIAAAVVITLFGVAIQTLSNPFGDKIIITHWSWLLVTIWLVVIGNVVNWLDSIDGVAGGVSAITLLILFLLSASQFVDQPANAVLAVVGFGATIGFLLFNLRGKVFLGDTGSIFLGFLIGVLAIISGGKVATAFLVLAIPFLDAVVVFFTRILSGQSPFLADRRHLIHRLIDRGYSKRTIILIFYAISLIFGLIALNTQTLGKLWAIAAAIAIMALFVLLYSSNRPMIGGNGND